MQQVFTPISDSSQRMFTPSDINASNMNDGAVPSRTNRSVAIIPVSRPYQNDVIARESMTANKIKQQNFSSSYLSMNSKGSQENLALISPTASFVSDTTWPRVSPPRDVDHYQEQHPDTFYSLQRPTKKSMMNDAQISKNSLEATSVSSPRDIPRRQHQQQQFEQACFNSKASYLLAQRISDGRISASSQYHSHSETLGNMDMQGAEIDSYSPGCSADMVNFDRTTNTGMIFKNRRRLKSKSLEDLTQYEKMSNEESNFYQNSAFRMSDEVASNRLNSNRVSEPGVGIYSYANSSKLVQLSSLSGEGYNYVQDCDLLQNQSCKNESPKENMVQPKRLYRKVSGRRKHGVRKSKSVTDMVDVISRRNTGNSTEINSEQHIKLPKSDQLAFANNLFKEELANVKAVRSTGSSTAANNKPNLMLSMFKRQQSGDSTRSMSESPVSPLSGRSPGPASMGITFTAKSKSFKRVVEHEMSTSVGSNSETEDNSKSDRNSGGSCVKPLENNMLLRRQSSEAQRNNTNKMEGRRLPSLPPDAFLSEEDNSVDGNGKYSAVKETLC